MGSLYYVPENAGFILVNGTCILLGNTFQECIICVKEGQIKNFQFKIEIIKPVIFQVDGSELCDACRDTDIYLINEKVALKITGS